MATSGTATRNFDIGEILEEAFEQGGLEMKSGYDLATGRRSLDLLTIEWANSGVHLWTLEQPATPITLVSGTPSYDLPLDTIDILDLTLRRSDGTSSQSDLTLSRMHSSGYSQIPSKRGPGQPIQYLFERKLTPRVTFWPVPDAANALPVYYWRMRRIEDVGSSIGNTMDVNWRFLPALIGGLACRIALKKAPDRLATLGPIYDGLFSKALDEDRDRTSVFLVPQMRM